MFEYCYYPEFFSTYGNPHFENSSFYTSEDKSYVYTICNLNRGDDFYGDSEKYEFITENGLKSYFAAECKDISYQNSTIGNVDGYGREKFEYLKESILDSNLDTKGYTECDVPYFSYGFYVDNSLYVLPIEMGFNMGRFSDVIIRLLEGNETFQKAITITEVK